VTHVHQDGLGEHVSSNEALYVMPSKRSLDNGGFADDLIGEDKADEVFVALHCMGRRSAYSCDTHGTDPQLFRQPRGDNTACRPCVDHRGYGQKTGATGRARSMEFFRHLSWSHPNFQNGP